MASKKTDLFDKIYGIDSFGKIQGKMKIGMIGPIWYRIPPKGYGGTELVVYNLVNGLVDKGHDVTLFGARNSKVKAKIFPTIERPLRQDNVEWENINYSLYHITEAFDRGNNFDIIHMHLNKSQDYISLPLAQESKTPVVSTLHFSLPTREIHPDRYLMLSKYRNLPFVSISNSQREGIKLNFIGTVYNGLDLKLYPFVENPSDYFVWIGKVNPVKGTKEAILAAKKANVRLKVVGAVEKAIPHLRSYYEREIKPFIDGKQIQWYGEIELSEKTRILGRAKGFLNPIKWSEPFGLVMAESLACGTPVIAFNRGSSPELVVNGKTGYLVKDIPEMVEKIKIIDKINRENCRINVEKNFSIEKMVESYEKSYNTAISNWN